MKKKCIMILFLFVAVATVGQPAIQWKKSLGGGGFDAASAICQTTDGGYIVAGSASSRGGDVIGIHTSLGAVLSDYWIVKLNADGTLQWQKCLGSSVQEYAYDIQQTIDGGYIVAGYSNAIANGQDVTGNHGGKDYWIVKLYNNGNIQWQKSFGGISDDYAYSIRQTVDGGYIVAGGSYSNDGDVVGNHGGFDYWILKLDNNGNLQWSKSLGGSKDDFARSIQPTNDNGYIVAGYSYSSDGNITGHHGNKNFDCWIVKLSSTGNIQWQRSAGSNKDDIAYAVQQTNEGGYIVAGFAYANGGDVSGNHGNNDAWIVKLNSSGNLQWQTSAGGTGADEARSIQQTTDGGYIIAGYSNSNNGNVTGNHGDFDYWIVKLTVNGNISWQKSLGGSNADLAYCARQSSDGGYIIAGGSLSNNGDVTDHRDASDYWIVKLSGSGNKLQETSKPSAASLQPGKYLYVYPNPATDFINVRVTDEMVSKEMKLTIFDSRGMLVKQFYIRTGITTISLKHFPAGTYFYEIKGQNEIYHIGRFLVQ